MSIGGWDEVISKVPAVQTPVLSSRRACRPTESFQEHPANHACRVESPSVHNNNNNNNNNNTFVEHMCSFLANGRYLCSSVYALHASEQFCKVRPFGRYIMSMISP